MNTTKDIFLKNKNKSCRSWHKIILIGNEESKRKTVLAKSSDHPVPDKNSH